MASPHTEGDWTSARTRTCHGQQVSYRAARCAGSPYDVGTRECVPAETDTDGASSHGRTSAGQEGRVPDHKTAPEPVCATVLGTESPARCSRGVDRKRRAAAPGEKYREPVADY